MGADGRYVAFQSNASNLVPGGTNGRQTGITTRVSVDSAGDEASDISVSPPAISGDGRYVAFHSSAWNLVPGDGNWLSDVFVHDRDTE